MTTTELKQYIYGGKLDSRLVSLYGAEKLERQRKRYLDAIDGFTGEFGAMNEVRLFSVPGRSEVSGNHTDHNNGKVLAASIDLDIIAVAAPSGDDTVILKSEGYTADRVDVGSPVPNRCHNFSSSSLIAGVFSGFQMKNMKTGGFRAYTTNDVFKGSGLSSSACFEVMIGNILRTLFDNDVSNVEIAKISQYAENVFFGKPCGLMDQTACAVGGFIAIDFENPSEPIVTSPDFDISAKGYSLCIVNTGGNHADLNADYASIPAEMKSVAAFFGKKVLREVAESDVYGAIPALRKACGDRAILRALHFFAENRRVTLQTDALAKGDIKSFLDGVTASGNSSFRFLQNVYTDKNVNEQGLSLALCIAERFLSGLETPTACRVHGGGFAGTIQAFVPTENTGEFSNVMDGVFGKGACHILKIRREGAICLV